MSEEYTTNITREMRDDMSALLDGLRKKHNLNKYELIGLLGLAMGKASSELHEKD